MATSVTTDVLAIHPFLRGMSEQYLEVLTRAGTQTMLMPGNPIAREGDTADRVYLIRDGNVVLEKQGRELTTLHAGDVLDWTAFVPPHKWTVTASVRDSVQAIEFDARALRDMCEQNPEFGYAFCSRLLTGAVNGLTPFRDRMVETR